MRGFLSQGSPSHQPISDGNVDFLKGTKTSANSHCLGMVRVESIGVHSGLSTHESNMACQKNSIDIHLVRGFSYFLDMLRPSHLVQRFPSEPHLPKGHPGGWFLDFPWFSIIYIIYIYNLIGSMYRIYANIGGILMVNVTIYSIHGSYGYIYNHPGSQPDPPI